MRRSDALVVLTHQIRHLCPYKVQEVPLAFCYKRANDISDTYCYGCTEIGRLREQFGLRTYVRKIHISMCAACGDTWKAHGEEAPYANKRNPRCPGFTLLPDEGFIYVALDGLCLEWMRVNLATGARERITNGPLVGAPNVVSDDRDGEREEAASAAMRRRRDFKVAKDKQEK